MVKNFSEQSRMIRYSRIAYFILILIFNPKASDFFFNGRRISHRGAGILAFSEILNISAKFYTHLSVSIHLFQRYVL
jgi:hypothetical protein